MPSNLSSIGQHTPRSIPQRWLSAFGAAALGWAGLAMGPANAAINFDNSAELMLVIWDPTREVSYTKDLGITVDSFFATGQQDAGYQNFWNLTAGDTALQQLLSLGTAVSSLRWAVVGLDGDGDLTNRLNPRRTFTTLEPGALAGQINANYASLVALFNSDWEVKHNIVLNTLSELNTNQTGNPSNFHGQGGGLTDYSWNGTSFTPKGQSGYLDKPDTSTPNFGPGEPVSITNPIGRSSWFYYVTNSLGGEPLDTVVVDEFDNLNADGYWGLAQNPANNELVLSYTLTSALAATQAVTPEGRARASLTELRSGLASTRLISSPAGEFADWCPPVISAVPEPAAGWLLGAGGLALWLARRRGKGAAA